MEIDSFTHTAQVSQIMSLVSGRKLGTMFGGSYIVSNISSNNVDTGEPCQD